MSGGATSERTQRADELGRRVNGHPEDAPAVVPRLLAMLAEGGTEGELVAIIRAIGHVWDEGLALETMRWSRHSSDAVRLAVAQAIPHVESRAIWRVILPALLELMVDETPTVRDWATFALATSLLDLPAVRAALVDRLQDPDYDTRCEAMVGLALRRDSRALGAIAEAVRAESVGTLAVKAAGHLADRQLLEPLEALVDWWDVDPPLLLASIGACRTGQSTSDRTKDEWTTALDQ